MASPYKQPRLHEGGFEALLEGITTAIKGMALCGDFPKINPKAINAIESLSPPRRNPTR
jgi:hypothetical protein